jgi:hypothetical protein
MEKRSSQSFLELDGKTVFNVEIATTMPDFHVNPFGLSNPDPRQ